MKGENCETSYAGATACFPSGKRTGQKVVDLQIGKTNAPLTEFEAMIFFQVAIIRPTGGQRKRVSDSQETEKASVAKEPGKANSENQRSQRLLDGLAKGSSVNPEGKLAEMTSKET